MLPDKKKEFKIFLKLIRDVFIILFIATILFITVDKLVESHIVYFGIASIILITGCAAMESRKVHYSRKMEELRSESHTSET